MWITFQIVNRLRLDGNPEFSLNGLDAATRFIYNRNAFHTSVKFVFPIIITIVVFSIIVIKRIFLLFFSEVNVYFFGKIGIIRKC